MKKSKPVQTGDIQTYRFPAGITWAPGGKRAAFTVANANEEENGYESRLYLYENGAVRRLTDLGGERSFVWLDEDRLLFPAVRTAKERERSGNGEPFTSYYVLDLRGGEAVHAFTLPFAAEALKVVAEGVYAVVGQIDARIPDYCDMTDEARAQVLKNNREDADYEVFDETPFWMNGAGVTNKKRSALFLVRTESMSVRRVTEPTESVLSLCVRGSEVFYGVTGYESRMSFQGCAIRCLDTVSEQVRTAAENNRLELDQLITVGQDIWVIGTMCERFGINENPWIYRLTEQGLEVVCREEYSTGCAVTTDVNLGGGAQCAAKGGSLYHLTTRGGSCHLYRCDPDGSDTPVLTPEGAIRCFSVCEENDTALAIGLFGMQLNELYAFDLKTGAMKQLTHFNREALSGRYVAQPQHLAFENEGRSLEGWVLLPKDFDPSCTYPAVLDIHGGPKTVYGPVFMHEMQVWAGRGAFVFFCNPTGSDGGDNTFADIRGDYGGRDYRDLMAFTDAVLAAWPQIDPKRVCVTGGSYGGFMTNWIIGHTDRFCAAASQRSISNWVSMWGISDIGIEFTQDQTAAGPYDRIEKLWAQSPLRYADQAVTPTLFIHSDQDYRCPQAEGMQMLTALLNRGVPARMCLFHGENHELSRSGKPKHRLRRLQEITDWFATYAHF